MALTTNNCRDAFKDTLRALPAVGDNVDLPQVEPNIDALGDSVRLIIASLAEAVSDAAVDDAFWAWVSNLNAWMQSVRTWQLASEAVQPTGAPIGVPPTPPTSLIVDLK